MPMPRSQRSNSNAFHPSWPAPDTCAFPAACAALFALPFPAAIAEQQQAPTPDADAKESAQQWRSSMPSSFGRSWQGGSTGRIWQG
jgi:hypothetical protein